MSRVLLTGGAGFIGTHVAAALTDIDAVVHLAALVGLGVDLDDLPGYVGCNDLATAVLLAGMARAGVRPLVLASSMVVYGEGAYTCAAHGPVRPAPRAEADLATDSACGGPPGRWRAYNIASGRPATVGDLATELARAVRGPTPVVTGDYRLGDVRHVVASADRAAAELGFRAAVPLSAGVAEFAGHG